MKGGARCKCECEHSAKCKCGVKCECRVKYKHEHEAKYECCEARVQSEIHKVGCILFVLFFLSVYTGDIGTKAMVGADIAA